MSEGYDWSEWDLISGPKKSTFGCRHCKVGSLYYTVRLEPRTGLFLRFDICEMCGVLTANSPFGPMISYRSAN
jgi:hypothetical protein